MAWIRTVPPEDAKGTLARIYAAAIKRAGKVFNILRMQSLRPRVLRASTQLYMEVMHSGDSALSRAQREMIATVVSRANHCYYWTTAHAEDLRVEVQDREDGAALAAAIADDYRKAALSAADRGMLDLCVKLTRTPAEVNEADIDGLRELGFDDHAIHDIVQVAALFNYYDRLADGLGIDPEPEWGPRPGDW